MNTIRVKALAVLVALIVASAVLSAAPSGKISGSVSDSQDKKPLPGANVFLQGTKLGASSDLNGKFVIPIVPTGRYKLVVRYIGYQTKTIDIVVGADQELKEVIALDPEAVQGEVIVVTAQAEGQLGAINQQLASDKIANIVSEQRIQELPDFNAAAAISRLPGVSTTQSSGEDNKVIIRGLSPKYNSIEVEGVKLSATGSSQIGLSSNPEIPAGNINNDRSVDLTMVSPYMIRTIAVYKSLTPDMNANSIGGTVNMELREAPSGLHTDLLFQGGYTAKSNTYGNYRAVASGSRRFFDDKLGVYGLFNAESYDRDADNLSADYGIASSIIDSATGFRPAQVNTVTFNRHLETRKRYGGNLILDYNLPHGSLKFVNMYARLNSDFTDHRQNIRYDSGRMEWQLRLGENVTDQQLHSLKLDYDLGFLTADLSASYTASSNVLDESPRINFNQTDALQAGVRRDNLKPEDITYLLANFKGVNEVVLRSGDLLSNDYQEDKYTYKADFQLPLNIGTAASGFFKFGGQYNKQSNSTDQETPYLGFNGSATGTGTDIQSNLMRGVYNSFGITTNSRGELTGTSFLNSNKDLFNAFLDNRFGNVFFASNSDLLVNILKYIIGNPAFDASNRDFSSGAQGGWYDGPYQQLTNDYKYDEDYYAAYGMTNFNFLDFTVIGGARYEKVKTKYFAYNARDLRNAQNQVMYDTTDFKENEFWLPMGQIKYSPFTWMDIRYAYTQTLARPDYQSISPKFTITQGNQIFTGNPELKPAKAFNHDVNLTFYSNKLGLLTIGGFYKTIENFVYNANYQLDAADLAGLDTLSHYQIRRNGALVVTPTLTNGRSNASVFRPLNNPYDATVKGLEFDFQHRLWYAPGFLNNTVLGINYARIKSATRFPFFKTRVIPGTRPPQFALVDSSSSGRLLDQPNHILNAYVGYDYKGFSSRLSLVFQANSARGNGGEFPENDSFTKDYFRMDFSARQRLPYYNSELFLDVSNLNDRNTSWIQRSTEGFRGIDNYGLTANLGLRVRY
jgi:TonB-dependent receptor